MPQKPRPAREPQYVFTPANDTGYAHFTGAAEHPFDALAPSLGRRNAWWLAEAALLAYWGPDAARQRAATAGLTAKVIAHGGTDGYLLTGDGFTIVAFRGTQPDQISDVFDDVKLLPAQWRPDGSMVHLGFRDALDRVWDGLLADLGSLAGAHSIWFTGHSLGAALATLAADRFDRLGGTHRAAGVLTLGSPRVGNAVFTRAFDARLGARSRRYVAAQDVVTHLPTSWFGRYAHVGPLCQITRDGTIEPPHAMAGGDDWLADIRAVWSGSNPLRKALTSWAPEVVLDHMPRGYAVDIWNDYDGNGE